MKFLHGVQVGPSFVDQGIDCMFVVHFSVGKKQFTNVLTKFLAHSYDRKRGSVRKRGFGQTSYLGTHCDREPSPGCVLVRLGFHRCDRWVLLGDAYRSFLSSWTVCRLPSPSRPTSIMIRSTATNNTKASVAMASRA